MTEPRTIRDRAAAVRQAAPATAFSAALLLYFGFVHFAAPSGGDLFSQASSVLYHTLRIGGAAIAVAAAWLGSGHRPALLVAGIVAVGVGSLMMLAAAGMLIDGGSGVNSLIVMVCGGSFVAGGLRDIGTFRARMDQPVTERAMQLGSAQPTLQESETVPEVYPGAPELRAGTPPGGYLASFAGRPINDERQRKS